MRWVSKRPICECQYPIRMSRLKPSFKILFAHSTLKFSHAVCAHQLEGVHPYAISISAANDQNTLYSFPEGSAGWTEACSSSLHACHDPQILSFRRELPSRNARLTDGRPTNELIGRTGSARRGDPLDDRFGRYVGQAHRPGESALRPAVKGKNCKLALVTSARRLGSEILWYTLRSRAKQPWSARQSSSGL